MQTAAAGRLIRAEQVAKMIGVSTRVASGIMRQMARVNIGLSQSNPRWAVYESDVNAWIESRKTPADVPGKPNRTRRKSNIAHMSGLLDESGHIPRRR